MLLSDRDIRKALRNGVIRIEPEPSEEQFGAASVDLTLSGEFWEFRRFFFARTLDVEEANPEFLLKKVAGEKITLQPGDMCLGKTLEKITIPGNIAGRLEGRSRYARLGVAVHVTSSAIQPGSSNRQVLEIVNLSPFPILLRKGMRISQVFFEKLTGPTSKPYAKFGKIARVQ